MEGAGDLKKKHITGINAVLKIARDSGNIAASRGYERKWGYSVAGFFLAWLDGGYLLKKAGNIETHRKIKRQFDNIAFRVRRIRREILKQHGYEKGQQMLMNLTPQDFGIPDSVVTRMKENKPADMSLQAEMRNLMEGQILAIERNLGLRVFRFEPSFWKFKWQNRSPKQWKVAPAFNEIEIITEKNNKSFKTEEQKKEEDKSKIERDQKHKFFKLLHQKRKKRKEQRVFQKLQRAQMEADIRLKQEQTKLARKQAEAIGAGSKAGEDKKLQGGSSESVGPKTGHQHHQPERPHRGHVVHPHHRFPKPRYTL